MLRLFGPLPTLGEARVEARFAGFDGEKRFPRFNIQLIVADEVRVELCLVEILLPKGPLGTAQPFERRAFLRDRQFVPGVGLGTRVGSETVVRGSDVRLTDWLPGNVARIYGVRPGADLIAELAVKDHVGRQTRSHPSSIRVLPDHSGAVAANRPLRVVPIGVERSGEDVVVVDGGATYLDLAEIRAYWRSWFDIGPWPVEDIYYALIERFVGDVVLADPDDFASLSGRSSLYVANHQTGIESLLFSVLISALYKVPTVTLAKAEHRTSWIGQLIQHSFSYPGVQDPGVITYFDREDRESLVRIIGELAQEMTTTGKSAMVHVEGTRGLSCRTPVIKMSSAFIDMALATNSPIVPVRFVGGLPVEPLEVRTEYPVGFGRQDYWIGRALMPEVLRQLPLKERKQTVIDAINGLGVLCVDEQPYPPDRDFGQAVADRGASTGVTPEHAGLFEALRGLSRVESKEVAALLSGEALEGVTDAQREWAAVLTQRLSPRN
jgi:1-acyl-sn-glycerol-3-phosphate acyltransferase